MITAKVDTHGIVTMEWHILAAVVVISPWIGTHYRSASKRQLCESCRTMTMTDRAADLSGRIEMGGSVSMIGGHIDEVLKPCPFCGGKAHLDREEIFCDFCGAKMPIELYVYGVVADDRCPTYQEAKAEMVEAWNRRADT